MSQFCFSPITGHKFTVKQSKRLDRIASKHGASFEYVVEPTGQHKAWFAGPNLGNPFDRALAKAVMEDVRKVPGLWPEDEADAA